MEVAKEVFQRVDNSTDVNVMLEDGASIAPGAYVMEITGKARSILTAERTAINGRHSLLTGRSAETSNLSGAALG